jgi:hypothetical protein
MATIGMAKPPGLVKPRTKGSQAGHRDTVGGANAAVINPQDSAEGRTGGGGAAGGGGGM